MKVQIFQFNNDNKELSFLSEAGWQTSHFDDFPENVKQAIQLINEHANELRPIEEKRLDETRANQEKLANENASVKQQNRTLEEANTSLKTAIAKLFSSAEIQANIDSYPEYEVGKAYAPGDTFRYQGKLYITVQAHTSQADWLPNALPALYTPIEVIGKATDGSDIKEFKQPTGAHDAYKKGDKVRYNGKVYESLIDNNAYSPVSYPQGWKEVN